MIKWLIGLYLLLCWAPAPLSPFGEVSLAVGVFVLAAFFLVIISTRRGRLLPYSPAATLGKRVPHQIGALVTTSIFIVLISAASALQTDEPLRAARIGFGHLSGIIIIWAMLQSPREWPLYMKLLLGGAIVSSLLGAGSYLVPSLHSIMFGERDRTAVFFKQVNQLGIVLTCVFPFACVLFSQKFHATWMKLTAPLVAPLVLAGIVATGSKTNLVIAAASFAGLILLTSLLEKGGARRIFSLIAASCILVLLAPLSLVALEQANPRAYRILSSFLAGDTDIGSINHRFNIWAYSIEAGLSQPLTGEGPREVYGFPHSHNAILDYFRVLGFPGLISILYFCGLMVAFSLKGFVTAVRSRIEDYWSKRVVIASGLSILSYLVSNQMSDSFGPSTFPFVWASLGILLCAAASLRNDR